MSYHTTDPKLEASHPRVRKRLTYCGEQTSVNVLAMSVAASVSGNAASIAALARSMEFVRNVLCSPAIYHDMSSQV
jgi:hypothetical protein